MIDTYRANVQRSEANAEALHYVNAPTHASAMVQQLFGELSKLRFSTEDDPLLYAYQILDRAGRMAGLLIAIEKWAYAVRDATPDQIEETGAQLCR